MIMGSDDDGREEHTSSAQPPPPLAVASASLTTIAMFFTAPLLDVSASVSSLQHSKQVDGEEDACESRDGTPRAGEDATRLSHSAARSSAGGTAHS